MSLTLTIAWRYLRRPTDRLVSAVGVVSILGLVIGVMALVISMGLMTGYRRDLQQKLLGGNAEIFVYAIDGVIERLPATLQEIEKVPGVAAASPVVFQYSLVTSEQHTTGEQVMLKGVDPSRIGSTPMLRNVFANGTSAAPDRVALGRHLADRLGVQRGDALTVTVPSREADSLLPKSGVFIVSNIFETGFFEFDAKWMFMRLDAAEELLGGGAQANLIEVKLSTDGEIGGIVEAIEAKTERRYAVNDWRQMNRQLFSLLAIQQLVLFIVIGLIVFVSTFNIVSTLIMTVHEKRKEIGILMTLGADSRMIRRVFIWYGTLVGVIGTTVGIVLGVIVCQVITRYELISLGPDIAQVYFVSSIPFVNRLSDIAVIALFASVVSYLATLIPSLRSARLHPVEALRAQ